MAKSGPFGKFGVVRRTPAPPGYGPVIVVVVRGGVDMKMKMVTVKCWYW